ncbi:hypothetical protein A7982_13193 [Minicystis rosea]|nr:hypothetical protein A7982_13193 [Minicystis rosea]
MAIAAIVIGAGLRARRDRNAAAAPSTPIAEARAVGTTPSVDGRAKAEPAQTPTPGMAALPPDVLEALEKGPKEPLVPRELVLEAHPAPGSVVTAEPLVPRELPLEAKLAPGSVLTAEPLVPRELPLEAAPARP